MTLPFSDLLDPISREEATETTLEFLSLLGFNSRSWQSGSWQLSIASAISWVYASLSDRVAETAKLRFNDTATGIALQAVAKNDYDNDPITAVTAIWTIDLEDVSGDGPHVIAVGDIVLTDTIEGATFRNTTGGTLPQSSTLQLTFEAEVAGASGNAAFDTITEWVTPIAGVTATNPSGSQVRSGVDDESVTALRERNRLKWSTLSLTPPADAYRYWALNAEDGGGDHVPITRASVNAQNPGGPGTVYVYVANSTGTATAQEIADVQTWIDSKKSVTADATVFGATPVIQSFAGTIWLGANYTQTDVQTLVEEAIADYVNNLPIGGTKLVAGSSGVAQSEQFFKAVMNVEGVEGFDLTTPAGDPVISANGVMQISSFNFTYLDLPAQT